MSGDIGGGLVLGFVLVGGIAAYVLMSEWSKNQSAKQARAEALSLASHAAQHFHAAPDGMAAIAICEPGTEVRLVSQNSAGNQNARVIRPSQIIEAAIVVDDQPVVVSRREGSLARAALGGALLGGVGAVVGATTAGSSSTTIVRAQKMSLRLIINDSTEPEFEVGFLPRNGAYRHSAEFKQADADANRWLARLKVLMHQAANL